MTATLTEAEVASFHENGFVMPDFQLPDVTVQEMRDAYDKLLADNMGRDGFDPDFILGPQLSTPGSQGTIGNPKWLDFAHHPDIISLVSGVAGPDLILWGMSLFGKPAGCGKETPWHQDGDYYPIDPLETFSVWIALDDATPENGCLRYMPGSHKERRIYPHHWVEDPNLTLTQVINDEYVEEDRAVNVVRKAGQLAIHDVYMTHQSGPNHSDKRRCGVVFRIMPATSFYNHAKGAASDNPSHDYSRRPLYLLSGEDKAGRNDFSIGHA